MEPSPYLALPVGHVPGVGGAWYVELCQGVCGIEWLNGQGGGALLSPGGVDEQKGLKEVRVDSGAQVVLPACLPVLMGELHLMEEGEVPFLLLELAVVPEPGSHLCRKNSLVLAFHIVKEEGLMGVGVDVYDRRWERVDIPIRVYGVNGDLEPVVSV